MPVRRASEVVPDSRLRCNGTPWMASQACPPNRAMKSMPVAANPPPDQMTTSGISTSIAEITAAMSASIAPWIHRGNGRGFRARLVRAFMSSSMVPPG